MRCIRWVGFALAKCIRWVGFASLAKCIRWVGFASLAKCAFAILLVLTGCRVADTTRTDTTLRGSGPPPALSAPALAARCDPSACPAFCQSAACLFDSAARCLAACRERCGDAYFEPADAELMSCAGSATSCDAAKACCQTHFTSHLCGD